MFHYRQPIVMQEYSIWLVPDEDTEEYETLDDIITEYSNEYTDAPDFKPHVTVAGGIEKEQNVVEEATQNIADNHDGLELSFIDASCSTTNHQCVFLLVDPSVELLELHAEALDLLDEDLGMYVPHLSLIYSDMGFEDRVHEVSSIDPESVPNRIQIDTVEVFDTTGPVSNWERTQKYPFYR